MPIVWLAFTLLLSGCGIIFPSHHRAEDYTPIFAAASGGDLDAVRLAVGSDPLLLTATEWDKATLLHDAVQHNHMAVAAYLLGKGADVDATTEDGLTPLHMAAQNGAVDMIELLLMYKAAINAVDTKGWTPVDRAIKWNHGEAADILEQHGGRSNVTSG